MKRTRAAVAEHSVLGRGCKVKEENTVWVGAVGGGQTRAECFRKIMLVFLTNVSHLD